MNTNLESIRARCEAATKGPWDVDVGIELLVENENDRIAKVYPLDPQNSLKDATFIAHAREDIPYLLSEIDRLTAENARQKGALAEWVDGICISQKHLTQIGKLQKEADDAYMNGLKKAIYEIMKEADIPGSNEIRNSGDSDDGMCAQVARRIEARLTTSQRRERAAVEIVTLVGRAHRLCGFCEGEGDRCKRYDFGGCSFDWRGPVAGEGEAE